MASPTTIAALLAFFASHSVDAYATTGAVVALHEYRTTNGRWTCEETRIETMQQALVWLGY